LKGKAQKLFTLTPEIILRYDIPHDLVDAFDTLDSHLNEDVSKCTISMFLNDIQRECAEHVNRALNASGDDQNWLRSRWAAIFGLTGAHRELMFKWIHENKKLTGNTMLAFNTFMHDYAETNHQEWNKLPFAKGFLKSEGANQTKLEAVTLQSERENSYPEDIKPFHDQLREIAESPDEEHKTRMLDLAEKIRRRFSPKKSDSITEAGYHCSLCDTPVKHFTEDCWKAQARAKTQRHTDDRDHRYAPERSQRKPADRDHHTATDRLPKDNDTQGRGRRGTYTHARSTRAPRQTRGTRGRTSGRGTRDPKDYPRRDTRRSPSDQRPTQDEVYEIGPADPFDTASAFPTTYAQTHAGN
jgi:hypothetical protein